MEDEIAQDATRQFGAVCLSAGPDNVEVVCFWIYTCIYVYFLYFTIFSDPASGATVAVVAMYPWHSCFLPL